MLLLQLKVRLMIEKMSFASFAVSLGIFPFFAELVLSSPVYLFRFERLFLFVLFVCLI